MPGALQFLDHDGEMAARIKAFDWTDTPLGPPEQWPERLQFAVDLMLASTYPTAIYWGPELILLYNDAWAPIPADRHPQALGRPGAQVWADIWDAVGPEMEAVLATGKGFTSFDQFLPMERNGRAQETWWNYSFTPIRGEDGVTLGILNQGNETTRSVLGQRTRLAEVSRLRELFEQAPGPVALIHGPDHVFDIANPAYCEMIGRDDLVGKRLVDVAPEVAGQGYMEMLDRVYATGQAFRGSNAQVELRRAPGGPLETRILDFVCQPIVDANGNTTDILMAVTDVTDRARAEEALRTSQERLELALESSIGIGTWFWDVPGDRVTADARFLRLYGVDEALAGVGAPIGQFFVNIHPDDAARTRAAIDATLQRGVPFNEEYRLVQPDGSVRWVSAQGKCNFDAAGKPLSFPGVSFDITERKEAEESARAIAEELRQANEAQSFIYTLTERLRASESPDEIMAIASEALLPVLGADRVGFYRVIAGETIRFGPVAYSGRLPELPPVMVVAEIGETPRTSYRGGATLVINDAGEDARLADSIAASHARAAVGVPLLRGGEWVATMSVHQGHARQWTAEEIAFIEAIAEISWDAVERASGARALRDSEEKFRAIANSIDPMVWSTLPDGYHDYYNDRWYEFTGVPHASTDGEGWANVFHVDDQDRAWSLWRQCLATGEPYHIEYRLRHHSGQYRWVLGRAQPVRATDGRIIRWFGTCTDIQEIVDAREVLARSREELEAAIAERTRQLMAAEEQLRQAQKMEAVGQLTGGIAHDFNNMLAVVIGALDLLDRRVAQGRTDLDRYLVAARDGATRAAALTQRLLAFSRQQPLAPVAVDANAMIEGMIELLVRTLGEGVTIETMLAGQLPPILTDANQIENVVLNLAVNARDAMPRGGTLTIGTQRVWLEAGEATALNLSAGAHVEITVADSGVGMAPDVIARAFDPFFTTKGVGKGTGLGLSQVFGVIRQSGGAVRIDSGIGEGTTVRLLLPAHDGVVLPAGSDRKGETPRARPGESVLVVEDEERVRLFSIEALRELGYTVTDARDGREALRLIERGHRVSLLFSDVVMPEMSGRELAERARMLIPDLKVLLTSGYTPDVTGDDAGILYKPFDVDALARRVRATLDA